MSTGTYVEQKNKVLFVRPFSQRYDRAGRAISQFCVRGVILWKRRHLVNILMKKYSRTPYLVCEMKGHGQKPLK
jgi:hypothetical protein